MRLRSRFEVLEMADSRCWSRMETMVMKRSHPIRNGVIATVIGGLILSVIPPSRGFLVDLMLWTWAGIMSLWISLISNYSVSGWAFLIVGLLAFVGFAHICKALAPKNETAHLEYLEDVIYGAKWRWSWQDNGISNLRCFCPTCDAELIATQRHGRTFFSLRKMSS